MPKFGSTIISSAKKVSLQKEAMKRERQEASDGDISKKLQLSPSHSSPRSGRHPSNSSNISKTGVLSALAPLPSEDIPSINKETPLKNDNVALFDNNISQLTSSTEESVKVEVDCPMSSSISNEASVWIANSALNPLNAPSMVSSSNEKVSSVPNSIESHSSNSTSNTENVPLAVTPTRPKALKESRLHSPRIFSLFPRNRTFPHGLRNYRNTCYLNSILQSLASLPTLDERLREHWMVCPYASQAVIGRKLSPLDCLACTLACLFSALYYDFHDQPQLQKLTGEREIDFLNLGAKSPQESLLMMGVHFVKGLGSAITSSPSGSRSFASRCILEPQRLVKHFLPKIIPSFCVSQQEDAHEVVSYLVDRLGEAERQAAILLKNLTYIEENPHTMLTYSPTGEPVEVSVLDVSVKKRGRKKLLNHNPSTNSGSEDLLNRSIDSVCSTSSESSCSSSTVVRGSSASPDLLIDEMRMTQELEARRQILLTYTEEKIPALRRLCILSQLFNIATETCITCKVCGTKSKRYEESINLPLQLPQPNHSTQVESNSSGAAVTSTNTQSDKYPLREALRTFTNVEALDAGSYACDVCGKRTDAVRSERISRPPFILLVHIHRFAYSIESGMFEKNLKTVEFSAIMGLFRCMQPVSPAILNCIDTAVALNTPNSPVKSSTDTEKYQKNSSSSNTNINVPASLPPARTQEFLQNRIISFGATAAIFHEGHSMQLGHYTTAIKSSQGDSWYLCNDASIEEFGSFELMQKQIRGSLVMIFYSAAFPNVISKVREIEKSERN